MIERRTTNGGASVVSASATTGGKPGEITGYAAVFYDGTPATQFELMLGIVERIATTAFNRAIRERDDCRALFNHDANNVLGRTRSGTLRLSVDATGLKYQITPADTTMGRDVYAVVKRGDVSGSSFAFEVLDEVWMKEGSTRVRLIRDVRLYDVGPVTFPAYESTTSAARAASIGSAQ